EDDLEGGPDVGVLEMAADRGAAGVAEHDVHVRDRLLVGRGQVAEERQHLDLVVHLDRKVLAPVAIELAERGALETTDAGDLRGATAGGVGGVHNGGDRVVPLVGDQDDDAAAVDLTSSGFHGLLTSGTFSRCGTGRSFRRPAPSRSAGRRAGAEPRWSAPGP